VIDFRLRLRLTKKPEIGHYGTLGVDADAIGVETMWVAWVWGSTPVCVRVPISSKKRSTSQLARFGARRVYRASPRIAVRDRPPFELLRQSGERISPVRCGEVR